MEHSKYRFQDYDKTKSLRIHNDEIKSLKMYIDETIIKESKIIKDKKEKSIRKYGEIERIY